MVDTSVGYRVSRWWNRLAYFVIKCGRKMIWDYTGQNESLLGDMDVCSQLSESVFCDKPARFG